MQVSRQFSLVGLANSRYKDCLRQFSGKVQVAHESSLQRSPYLRKLQDRAASWQGLRDLQQSTP
jgi:hypothetical protein